MMDQCSNLQRMVGRVEDLPYSSSPPIQFTYQSTATLSLGYYTWADGQLALTPTRPLLQNALYYFRSITLAANIEELDFTSNITTTPAFYMFQKSHSNAILFREPVLMVKFLQQFEFRQAVFSQLINDQLYAAFRGVLVQGPNLIGKQSITLTAIISAQEVVDDGFIKMFTKKYPDGRY